MQILTILVIKDEDSLLQLYRIVLEKEGFNVLTVKESENSQMLPQKEFFLLFKLISYPNKIFTRMQLMDEIWGRNSESDLQTIDVHINRLRRRFEHNPDFEIITVRGLGYKAVMKE